MQRASLLHEEALGFFERVNVGVMAVAVMSEQLHVGIFQVAHAKAEDGQINARLAFLLDEAQEGAFAGLADVEVAIRTQNDAIDAVFNEVFRSDVVGSLLRLSTLLEAREKLKKGEITAETLRKLEDDAIRDAVKLQENVGLQAVTDGEFRRELWHMDFLAKFDAIFTLNQDLLIEQHYILNFGAKQGRWSGVVIPGMQAVSHDAPHFGALNQTWEPSGHFNWPDTMQPYFKLHGSTNWMAGPAQLILVMGNQKSGAVDVFPVLRQSHDFFASALNKPNARLMVVGYSFQDEHINNVIESASAGGLGIHIVDPSGSDVLKDPNTRNAPIKVRRSIEDIKLIGELRRPLNLIFSGKDSYAHGELMRFFK
jgi:hypothetical protein